jgi:hypothetical protein
MLHSLQVRLLLAEASISLESALGAAEQVASHGIVESSGFEGLMTFVHEAVIAVDKVKAVIAEGEERAVDDTPLFLGKTESAQRQPPHRSKSNVRGKMAKLPAIRIVSNREIDD